MPDLIDRAALVEQFRKKQIFEVFPEWEELENSTKIAIIRLQRKFREVILSAPTVDAVPVVRCKDCIRRNDTDECPMCHLSGGQYYEYTSDNGFCDKGERKDNG